MYRALVKDKDFVWDFHDHDFICIQQWNDDWFRCSPDQVSLCPADIVNMQRPSMVLKIHHIRSAENMVVDHVPPLDIVLAVTGVEIQRLIKYPGRRISGTASFPYLS